MANKLNNKDFKTTFGTIVELGGTDAFIQFPDKKDSLSHNFPERNGIDKDLTNPKFNARKFKLMCVLTAKGADEAATKAEFWRLWDGMFTELSGSGVHELFLDAWLRSFQVEYLSQANVKRETLEPTQIVVSFELNFGELDPFSNIQKVYLVDHNDRYLIA